MTTALMLDQYNSVKASLSPLTTPDDTFRIPDIKRFALSETEMTAALQDKKLDQLVEDCSHHRRVNNTNDKDEKSKLNSNIKSRRRILIMRALKDNSRPGCCLPQVSLHEDEVIDYDFQFNESSSSDENDEMQEKTTIKKINTEEDDDEDIDTEMEVFLAT
ncbi:unnamed protein product [Mucor circinelloides]